MAKKGKNRYLYLTLACFLGLIAIFIVDGYMGIYDTVYITAGEQEQRIEPDFWLQRGNTWSSGVAWGDKMFFRYEVDNRDFSSYTANVEVSLWQSQQKLRDLAARQITITPFKKGSLEWTIDTADLIPEVLASGQRAQYTVIIKRGEMERRIIININPSSIPIKPPEPTLPR